MRKLEIEDEDGKKRITAETRKSGRQAALDRKSPPFAKKRKGWGILRGSG
jgi:hypothetical protein